MSFLLCGSSIFTLVWSKDVRLKMSLFISAGSWSTKNIGSLTFVVLWIMFDTWRTVYHSSSYVNSRGGRVQVTDDNTIVSLHVIGKCGIAPHSLLGSG